MRTDAFRGEVLRGKGWGGRDFSEKSVAVIANGEDAARIVPTIVRTARAVKVFQTEPSWILPRLPGPVESILHALGGVSRPREGVAEKLARLHLFARVRDPWMRRLLTPDVRFDRPGFATSSSYYAALRQPHCKLVHWPVYAVVERGVRSAEGIEHRVDCIVLPDPAVLRMRNPGKPATEREEPTA